MATIIPLHTIQSLIHSHPQITHPQTLWQFYAHFVVTTAFDTPSWLPDSDASHYVTTNLSNLSFHSLWNNIDDIMIDNDTPLLITCTSSTFVTTPTATFALNNILMHLSWKRTWFQFLNITHLIMNRLNSYPLLFLWRNFAWG